MGTALRLIVWQEDTKEASVKSESWRCLRQARFYGTKGISQERPDNLLPGLPIIVFQLPTALIILIHMLTMSMIIADSISWYRLRILRARTLDHAIDILLFYTSVWLADWYEDRIKPSLMAHLQPVPSSHVGAKLRMEPLCRALLKTLISRWDMRWEAGAAVHLGPWIFGPAG